MPDVQKHRKNEGRSGREDTPVQFKRGFPAEAVYIDAMAK
jgi:hypothetical protein